MRYKINNFAIMKERVINFWEIESNADFELCARQTFHHQYEHNSVYRSYCDLIHFNPADLKSIKDIPFLPIRFFKSHDVKSFSEPEAIIFTSSGTTGTETSKHYLKELDGYEKSFTKAFNYFYGDPKEMVILALLPSYLERQGSSLIYMADRLIQDSCHPKSGFYLDNLEELKTVIEALEAAQQPTLLLGVSFALLDLIQFGSIYSIFQPKIWRYN